MPTAPVKKRMKYAKDEYGKDILLKDNSLQVMMEWEKPYIEACIDALKPRGDALEIGFGLGYAAAHIQKFHPRSHTIVESNPEILAKAKEWAKKHSNVTIVEGNWQDILPKLGIYDIIFFNDYEPYSMEEVQEFRHDTNNFKKATEEAKKVKKQLEAGMKDFDEVRFSDEQVEEFAQEVALRPGVDEEYVMNFIANLAKKGQISAKQKTLFAKEFEKASKGTKKKNNKQWQTPKEFLGDILIVFVEHCLDKHMHPGSKISAFMGSPETKLKNPEFQKFILSRKDVRYQEKAIDVEVPPNCQYYTDDKALVIAIEKK